ncbi:hypothetical protein EV702DRAFT_249194 [Suillus placidus]|uniref:Uncharacterized protein n=1 Tax=Suillus placidus TaxID=48579 RepID=A0A9P7D8S0_9AGAM|nr:hypothetical protein EV702DRAFT_249194 [Suillus placidus]
MTTRLHVMYHRSRKILMFLVVGFLAVNITDKMITAITMGHVSGGELVLSGTYLCAVDFEEGVLLLDSMTLWEVFALCLAVWIAVKYFRELQRRSTGWVTRDCFTVLMKTRVVHFASFVQVAVSRCRLLGLSSTISTDLYSLDIQNHIGVVQIFLLMQISLCWDHTRSLAF